MKTRMFSALILAAATLFTLASQPAMAAFSETGRRYVSPRDVFNLLEQKFPVLKKVDVLKNVRPDCWSIQNRNATILGTVSPALGVPGIAQPSPGFVRWWGACADKVVSVQFANLKETKPTAALLGKYWPLELLQRHQQNGDYANLWDQTWQDLKPADRQAILHHAIEEMIGPDVVVKDLGLVDSSDALVSLIEPTLESKDSVWKVTQQIYIALTLREEFLIY